MPVKLLIFPFTLLLWYDIQRIYAQNSHFTGTSKCNHVSECNISFKQYCRLLQSRDLFMYMYSSPLHPRLTYFISYIQISYLSISPLLGNKERYPRFFRLVPDITQYFDGYSAILKKFNWRRVAVIYYDDEFTLNVCWTVCAYVCACVLTCARVYVCVLKACIITLVIGMHLLCRHNVGNNRIGGYSGRIGWFL